MFGSKLASAEKRITALVGLIASVGLNLSAEGDIPSDVLSAHVDGLKKAAAEESAMKLQAAEESLKVANEMISVCKQGMEAAGITRFMKDGEQITADAIKSATENLIAARAAKQIAQAGHPAALDIPKDAASSVDASAMSQVELAAAIQAEKDPVARKRLYTSYEKRFFS